MIRKIWDIVMPLVIMFACMIVGSIAVMAAAGLIYMVTPDPQTAQSVLPDYSLWATLVFYVLTILVMIPFFRVDTQRFGKYKNEWKLWQILAGAVGAFAAALVLNYLIAVSGLFELFPAYQDAVEQEFYGGSVWLIFIVNVILAPVAEEIVFRGMIYRRIRAWLGVPAAVLISALMFGAYHMNMVQFVYAGLMGVPFALYLEKSNSLVMPVIAHMTANFFAVSAYFL